MKRFKSFVTERSDLPAASPGVNPGFGGEMIGDNVNLADLSNDVVVKELNSYVGCLLYTSPSPRDS